MVNTALVDMRAGVRFRLARTLIEKMVGLIRTDVCPDGEVLLLFPCGSIHTFGMKEAIDVAFIDAQGYVLKAVNALPPRRFSACFSAAAVLERRCGEAAYWFECGDHIELMVN